MVAISHNIVSNSKELTGSSNKNWERANVFVMDLRSMLSVDLPKFLETCATLEDNTHMLSVMQS